MSKMQSDHSTLNKPTDFEFINEQALYQRGLRERVFHAVLFEVLGIAFATPLAMWMTQKPALSMAALSAVISGMRSEEHTSELQSRGHLVCRLLLEVQKRVY